MIKHVENLGFSCEQGSEDDVLDRYIQVAESTQADAVVRITGDCPLVDSVLVDQCIEKFIQSRYQLIGISLGWVWVQDYGVFSKQISYKYFIQFKIDNL